MKTQQGLKNSSGQGQSTSDRAFTDHDKNVKSKGISNAGGQRSDQTSSKDSAHKPEHKKG